MNLVLCGMMGSGKTTLGKALASHMKCAWVDTDDVLVERHGNITDIFKEHGEEYFRDLETKLACELSQKDNLVISTGGGFLLRAENVVLLQEKGNIVFLRAQIETLEARLKNDQTRPLLQGGVKEKLLQLIKVRYPLYEQAADFIVDVDEKSVEEIASEIINMIKKQERMGACAR